MGIASSQAPEPEPSFWGELTAALQDRPLSPVAIEQQAIAVSSSDSFSWGDCEQVRRYVELRIQCPMVDFETDKALQKLDGAVCSICLTVVSAFFVPEQPLFSTVFRNALLSFVAAAQQPQSALTYDWLVAFILLGIAAQEPSEPSLEPVMAWLGNDRALHGDGYQVHYGTGTNVPLARHDMPQVLSSLANFMQIHAEEVERSSRDWDNAELETILDHM